MALGTGAGLSVVFKAVDEISDKLESMANGGTRAADQFDQIGRSADNAYSNLQKGATESSRSLGELGNAESEAGAAGEEMGTTTADAMQSINAAMTALGAKKIIGDMVNDFREASDAAAEYETAIHKVMTIADQSKVNSQQMTDAITAMSNESGQSVSDLSEATYEAISASVDTAKAVQFVGTADKLAVGGFTESANAVDVLTTAINAYKMNADDAGKISDYLIVTQNLGKTTVDALAHSIGQVIPVASAYGVGLDNLSTAYAVMTANGINTANATTSIRAMLNELADDGSTVSATLKEKTGSSFSQLMAQGQSLGDVLQVLGDSVDGDATAFSNMWGSSRAAVGALSLYNSGAERYSNVLDQMKNSAGAADAAYQKMTSTEDFATKKLQNSMENMKVALGQEVNPALVKLQSGFTSFIQSITQGITKVPVLSTIMVGLGAGLMVTVGAITAVTVATNILIPALTAAGIASTAALGPFLLIGAAVGGLVAAFVASADAEANSKDSMDKMTYATQENYQKLQDTKEAYDTACEKYGETSDEASKLKYQVDDLTKSYEGSKQTMQEFCDSCDDTAKSAQRIHDELGKGTDAVRNEEDANLGLIQKLNDLTSANYITVSSEAASKAIIDQLNGSVDGLNMSFDELIKNQPQAIAKMKEMVEAQAKQDFQTEKAKDYYNALKERDMAQDKLSQSTRELTAGQNALTKAQEDFDEASRVMGTDMQKSNTQYSDALDALETAKKNVKDLTKAHDELNEKREQANRDVNSLADSYNAEAAAAENTAVAQDNSDEMAKTAIEDQQKAIEELCKSYDEAYNSAYESINSQMGLFDQMDVKYDGSSKSVQKSIDEMNKAWDSQLAYLDRYNQNMQAALDAGVSKDIVASLADGSADSAKKLDDIVQKVQKLGGAGSEEANNFVSGFNDKFAQITTAKETFSTNVATMKTDFDTNMAAIQNTMNQTVTDMNKSADASAAAKATMDAYVAQIKTGISNAQSAVNTLKFANSTLPIPIVPETTKHANGGIFDTPHYGVFAENGPEAFIPIDNSKNAIDVWQQTGKMLGVFQNGLNPGLATPVETYVQPTAAEQTDNATRSSEKTFTLNINGSGAIRMNGNASKEQMLSVLQENVKPVLMEIIKNEMMDEGDEAYEY